MDLHDLAQLGQLAEGRAFQVALQRTHVSAAGDIGEGFLAQTPRLPDGLQRLRQRVLRSQPWISTKIQDEIRLRPIGLQSIVFIDALSRFSAFTETHLR